MIIISIIAFENLETTSFDIPQAFVQAPLPTNVHKYILLSGPPLHAWLRIYPTDKTKLNPAGKLLIKLNKYLYGMKDAPNAFFNHLFQILSNNGYKTDFISDQCLIYKQYDNGTYFIGIVHVDDILAAASNQQLIDDFHQCLQSAFGPIPQNPINNYVGFHLRRDRENKTIYIDMPEKINKLKTKYTDVNWSKPYTTPSDLSFFTSDSEELDSNPKLFLSKLQSLRYIAYKYRFDILKEVAFLSTKANKPTTEDKIKLDRVLIYTVRSKNKRLKIQPKNLIPSFYVDASYGSHRSAVGHTGIVICIGESPIFCVSSKHKIITLSSTEAEAVALKEAMLYGIWIIGLYIELQIHKKTHYLPIEILQDNMSTIRLTESPGTFSRSKHQFIRYAFLQQQVALFNFAITHTPSKDMIADILTKPLVGNNFHKLVAALNLV